MSSAEARYLKISFDELLAKLKEYAESKAAFHKTRAIVLTGSLAKGTYTGTSDADILVIADDLPSNILERYALFADPEMSIDLEPRAYTTKEFISKVEEGDHFAVESLAIGLPLYGEQFFKHLKESVRKQVRQ